PGLFMKVPQTTLPAPERRAVVRIDVRSAQRVYPLFVGGGTLATLPQRLRDAGLADPAVVSVAPVWRHHGDRLRDLTGKAGPVLMSDGERAKTLRTVAHLYDVLAARHLTRSSTVVAVGG